MESELQRCLGKTLTCERSPNPYPSIIMLKNCVTYKSVWAVYGLNAMIVGVSQGTDCMNIVHTVNIVLDDRLCPLH